MLIAGGFLLYYVMELAAWFTAAPVFLVTIIGTLMLFAGGRRLLVGLPMDLAKSRLNTMNAAVVIAFVVGFIASRGTPTTLAALHRNDLMFGLAAMGFTLAAVVPLWTQGGRDVRALCFAALAAVVVSAAIGYMALEYFAWGVWSFERMRNVLIAIAVLNNLAFVPALYLAYRSPVEDADVQRVSA